MPNLEFWIEIYGNNIKHKDGSSNKSGKNMCPYQVLNFVSWIGMTGNRYKSGNTKMIVVAISKW